LKSPFLFCFIVCCIQGIAQQRLLQTDAAAALIAAENNFAATAADKSFKEAFLENLDSSGIVFNAGKPVNGNTFYSGLPNNDLLFKWYPVQSAINAGGDMGFTTGPYILLSRPNLDTLAAGNYFSVWRRNAEGAFKVLLDGGVTHTSKALAASYGSLPMANADSALYTMQPKQQPADANTADNAFTEEAAKQLPAAYAKAMASHCLIIRSNLPMALDIATNRATIEKLFLPRCSFSNKGSFYAADKSWFFTYGTASATGKAGKLQQGYFVHVWQYQPNGWKLLADVLQWNNPGL
jgi:hypothetical protein